MGSRRRQAQKAPTFPTSPGAIDESPLGRRGLRQLATPALAFGWVGYDVFRAFTTRGARRIIMVDSLDKAPSASELGRRRLLHRGRRQRQTAGLRLRQLTSRVGTCRGGREDFDP